MRAFDHYFIQTGVLSFTLDSLDRFDKIGSLYEVYGVSKVEIEKPNEALGEARFNRSEAMYYDLNKPIIRVYFDRDAVNVIHAIEALFNAGNDSYKTDLQIVQGGY